MRRALGAILITAWLTVSAAAQDRLPAAPLAYQQLDNPALEQQARDLMHELRCLVCQGQSIADSDAALAGDMRHEVRARLLAGDRPADVRRYLVERYGKWVTYDPPLDRSSALLWFGPLAFLLVGLWLAWGRLRGGSGQGETGTSV